MCSMARRTTTCMSASRASAQSTSASLCGAPVCGNVGIGVSPLGAPRQGRHGREFQPTEKIRHLSFLQLSGHRLVFRLESVSPDVDALRWRRSFEIVATAVVMVFAVYFVVLY